jgi:hypothetical protein
MVLGLVAHRVPRFGLGARRQTGRSPANSCGTVLLPYPRSLAQDVPFSSQPGNPHPRNPQPGSTASLAGARTPGTRASGTAARALPGPSPKLADTRLTGAGLAGTGRAGTRRRMEEREALRDSWTFGGCQSSANQFRPRGGPLYRVDGPSGFTQVAENHGRTISERHNRTPQRRARRV